MTPHREDELFLPRCPACGALADEYRVSGYTWLKCRACHYQWEEEEGEKHHARRDPVRARDPGSGG